jgi:hypothetical protein
LVKILVGLVPVVGQSKVASPKPVNVMSRLVKLTVDALITSKHPFVEGAGLPKKREQVVVVKVTGNGTEGSTTVQTMGLDTVHTGSRTCT